MQRIQPNIYCQLVVPFIEQGFFVRISNGTNFCARFLKRSSFVTFYLSNWRDWVTAFLFVWRDLVVFIVLEFLLLGLNSVFALILVTRSLIIVCFLGGIRSLPSFCLLTAPLISLFGSVFALFPGDVFIRALVTFISDDLAWWGFTSYAPSIYSVLYSFSNRVGSTKLERSAQNSSCWCCCFFILGAESSLQGFTTVCRGRTVAILPIISVLLTKRLGLTELFVLAFFWFRQNSKFLFRVKIKEAMFLSCLHLRILWLSFKQTPQNGLESIGVVSSKSNKTYSTVVEGPLIDITMSLDSLAFGEEKAAQRRGELSGDGYSTLIMRRNCDCRLQIVLYVVRRPSSLTVSSFSLLYLFHWRSVSASVFYTRTACEACWCSDHD